MKGDMVMCASRRLRQGHRVVVVILCLTVTLAIVRRVTAQETVHQRLREGLGAGQTKGAATAPVTMEEFSDFQCPSCGQFARETLPRLTAAYIATGKVRFIFRHFAILGPDSEAAAEATACAGAQGQFWPYHDRLFATQGRVAFTRENLLRFAQELRLAATDFTACLDTARFTPQVRAETRAAMALGLRGTPGFVINGRQLVGALPFEVFQSVIDEALATAASGISPVPQAGQPTTPALAK